MNKLLAILLIAPSITYASNTQTATPFPGAQKGINLWSVDTLDSSTKKKTIDNLKKIQGNGYNQTSSTDEAFSSLYNLPKVSKNEIEKYDGNNNPLDTHLKSDISKIKLSFNFPGIPGVDRKDIIGFAPAGGYTHQNGWDGVVEFAKIPNIGICSFTTFKIESVILYKEIVANLVNNKPADKSISGNWNTGFIYKINWYTDRRRNSLECADKIFNPEVMNKLINLATKIDLVLPQEN